MKQEIKVEVFKTNVDQYELSLQILKALHRAMTETSFHFDLDDCDRILVARGANVHSEKIGKIVGEFGAKCSVLEDVCPGEPDLNFAKFLAEKEF